MAFVPWSDDAASLLYAPAFGLVISRIVLAAVIIAAIVQDDSPFDDRSFWRTRPIAPATMMSAKLAGIALVFLGAPLAIVLAVAAALRVPPGHVPATIGQVLMADAPWIGLALVAAACTRRVAAALVTIPAVVIAFWAILGSASDVARRLGALPAIDERHAVPTMCVWAATALWVIAALLWWGRRRRPAAAGVACAGLAMVLFAWLFPSARLHARPRGVDVATVALALSAADVRAEPIDAHGTRMALLTTATVPGQPAESELRLSLRRARLAAGETIIHEADGFIDERVIASVPRRTPRTALLGIVDAARVRALAGRPMHFSGDYRVQLQHERVIAAGPLAAASTLAMSQGRLDIHGVRRPTADDSLLAMTSMVWTSDAVLDARPHFTSVRVRDMRDGVQYQAIRSNRASARIAALLIVPSFARPFGWQPIDVLLVPDDVPRIDPTRLHLELVRLEQPVAEPVHAALSFTMPALDGSATP